MNSVIVEKAVLERGKPAMNYYAVATTEPNRHSATMSLTYEAYVTPWNPNRTEVEALQAQIETQAEGRKGA